MRPFRLALLLAVVASSFFLISCGDAAEKPFPVSTYKLGEPVVLGHIKYTVYETQWLTHLGEGVEARVPQNRFFLVRMSAANTYGGEIIVPNFTLEDDSGKAYPELSSGDGVPNYLGYLRPVKANESRQGNALFDAPPGHYKLRLADETGEKLAYVDIPLSFVSETPALPEIPDKDIKK